MPVTSTLKREAEDEVEKSSSTGKQIRAEPRSDGQEPPPHDLVKSFTIFTSLNK